MPSTNPSIQHVEDVLEHFIANVGSHVDDIGYELKTAVVRGIVHYNAIDTTAMIQAIDYHRDAVTDTGYSLHVDASNNPDVFYDGFVELAQVFPGGRARTPKPVYQYGIEHSNFQRVFDEIARESFVVY